ncbi:MAG: 2OG-Fe(II) oxygenase family protein [Pseudomonadota bacterium]
MPIPAARAVRPDEVPVIDISALFGDGDVGGTPDQLAWAATEVGFIYVRGHGIGAEIMARARDAGLAFFRSPAEQKLALKSNIHHHGYLGPGATRMDDDAKLDLKESYNFGVELDGAALAGAGTRLLGPNQWPAFLPAFKPALYAHFEAATRTAESLLKGFALAGGHPPDTFTRANDRPVSRGSLQYYPPRPDDAEPDHFSLAPHTDFGVLTVLAQDSVGGLQIQAMDGEWLAVPPIDDTVVVNVGDLLGRWSNDTYRSTPHRVLNTSGRERLSLVLAYDPNAETLVDPRLFCGPGEQPNYEPITCGDYLEWRFAKAFAYRTGAKT